jgi:transglutaminase-like putative cysteine protease
VWLVRYGNKRGPRELAFFLHDRPDTVYVRGPEPQSADPLTMTLLTVRHVTSYRYRKPVSFGEHRMMFRPRDSYDQKLLDARLSISPEPCAVRWLHDAFGNCVAIANFRDADEATRLRFESNIWLDHLPSTGPEFSLEDAARTYPFSYSAEEMPDLMPAMTPCYPDPDQAINRWVRRFLKKGRATDTGMLLMTLTYALKEGFTYERRTEPGTRPPALTLSLGRGSCRDLALLMIEALRSLGMAARFVSGYLYSPSRGEARHRGGGSTHAWCEVYLPGAGWVEFDPTNAIIGNRDLIRVAVARDPSQAVPLWGSYFGASDDFLDMTVDIQVRSEDAAEGHPRELHQAPASLS